MAWVHEELSCISNFCQRFRGPIEETICEILSKAVVRGGGCRHLMGLGLTACYYLLSYWLQFV